MGADLDIVVHPIQQNKSPKLLKLVIGEAQKQLEVVIGIKKTGKETAAVGEAVERLTCVASCLEGRDDKTTGDFLVGSFDG